MTKTLTEQWRDGKLKDGSFYIERFGKYMRANCIGTVLYLENHDVIWSPNTVKILAPVPSYDEYKRLQEQIKEANEVIKKYSDGTIYLFPTWYNGSRLAEAYLKKWCVK